MPYSHTAQIAFRRVFTDGLFAKDIAEPLASFDDVTPADLVGDLAVSRMYDVVGVRQCGVVAGFAESASLSQGVCGDYLQEIETSQIVDDDTALSTVLTSLGQHPRLFVVSLGAISGIITHDDVQKPPVRMWLFGMLTLIELRMTFRIERAFPEEQQWADYISDSRFQKAQALQKERQRIGQDPSLLDCLQFGDKANILLRGGMLQQQFASKRQGERMIKQLESLRNNLAHSQDIVAYNADTILELAANLETVLAGQPEE